MNKNKTYYLQFFNFSCTQLEKKGFGRRLDTHRRVLDSFNLLPENSLCEKLKKDKTYWEKACAYLIRLYCNESNNKGYYVTYNEVEVDLEKNFNKFLEQQNKNQ